MLEVFDRETRQRVAILETAYGVEEYRPLNAIWTMQFSVPADSEKLRYIRPFGLVRYDGGELYRIIPQTLEAGDARTITVECEHVMATLMDNVLHGWHQVGNLGTYTDDVLRYILGRQSTENWKLGSCGFRRQFEYGWEQESLLAALLSVPKPFDAEYRWKSDTSVYPWTISLETLDTDATPALTLRRGHNLTSLRRVSDPCEICTRLYAYGAGEGVNQLSIASANGGVPYIEDADAIAKYGLIERVWVDRRYENAEVLLGVARRMLDGLAHPAETYEAECVNITPPEPGDRVRIIDGPDGVDHTDIVTAVRIHYGEETQVRLTLANRTEDIAQTVADLADRTRVETSYAQGATQIYEHTIQDNADGSDGGGLLVDFFVPSEMVYINKIYAKIRLRAFRAYSKATDIKGNVRTSTSEAAATAISGGSTNTSTSGGGSTTISGGSAGTSTSGGGSTTISGGAFETSSEEILPSTNIQADDWGGLNAANHNHGIQASVESGLRIALTDYNATAIIASVGWTPSGAHIHGAHAHTVNTSHSHSIPSHSHTVNTSHSHSIPSHSHTVNISHSHTIPAHSHTVDVSHSHSVTPGIFRFGSPKSFGVYINGEYAASFAETSAEIDLLACMTAGGKTVERGAWQTIEIRPDGLAHISCTMYTQGFIQSRGEKAV